MGPSFASAEMTRKDGALTGEEDASSGGVRVRTGEAGGPARRGCEGTEETHTEVTYERGQGRHRDLQFEAGPPKGGFGHRGWSGQAASPR